MTMTCLPGSVSNRPIRDTKQRQNVDGDANRALSTVAAGQAVGAAVLYQQKQLDGLHTHENISVQFSQNVFSDVTFHSNFNQFLLTFTIFMQRLCSPSSRRFTNLSTTSMSMIMKQH